MKKHILVLGSLIFVAIFGLGVAFIGPGALSEGLQNILFVGGSIIAIIIGSLIVFVGTMYLAIRVGEKCLKKRMDDILSICIGTSVVFIIPFSLLGVFAIIEPAFREVYQDMLMLGSGAMAIAAISIVCYYWLEYMPCKSCNSDNQTKEARK